MRGTAQHRPQTDSRRTDIGNDEPAALLRQLKHVGSAADEAQTVDAALAASISLIARHQRWAVGHAFLLSEDGSGCVPADTWYVREGLDADRFITSTTRTHLKPGEGVVGGVMQSGRPEWVANIHKDARWIREDGGLRLKSALFFPVRVHGAVRAVLEFYADRVVTPDAAMETLIGSVAFQLARALERIAVSRHAAMAVEQEQRQIGQELHDRLGQNLSALGLLAHNLQRKLESVSAPGLDMVGELVRAIEVTKLELRLLSKGLMPVDAEVGSLPLALQDLARRCRDLYCIRIQFEGDAQVDLSDRSRSGQLFRIAQEAVRNAVEHGHPTSVAIKLHAADRALTLEVADDGSGFGKEHVRAPGMGLAIMEHRAKLIGGKVNIDSAPGKGTVVRCVVPIP